MDEAKPPEGYNYWNDPRIHNEGFGGYIHSLVAPSITRMIDIYSCNGVNIRKELIKDLNQDMVKEIENLKDMIKQLQKARNF